MRTLLTTFATIVTAALLMCAPAQAEEYTSLFSSVAVGEPLVSGEQAGLVDVTVRWSLPEPPGVVDPDCFSDWQYGPVTVDIRRGRARDGELVQTLSGSGRDGDAWTTMRALDPTEESGFTAWIRSTATREVFLKPQCLWGVAEPYEIDEYVSFALPYLDEERACVFTVRSTRGAEIQRPGTTQRVPVRVGDTFGPGSVLMTRKGGRVKLTSTAHGRTTMDVRGTVKFGSGKCAKKRNFSMGVLHGSVWFDVLKGLGRGPNGIDITTANSVVGVLGTKFNVAVAGTDARPRTTVKVARGKVAFRNPARASKKRTVNAKRMSVITGKRGTPSKPRRYRG